MTSENLIVKPDVAASITTWLIRNGWVAEHEDRSAAESLRDNLSEWLEATLLPPDLRSEAEAALWIHHDRQIEPYSDYHHLEGHESEDDRCDPDLCFTTATICNGCGTRGCSERAIPPLRHLLAALTTSPAEEENDR
jgi:hypothetical protein